MSTHLGGLSVEIPGSGRTVIYTPEPGESVQELRDRVKVDLEGSLSRELAATVRVEYVSADEFASLAAAQNNPYAAAEIGLNAQILGSDEAARALVAGLAGLGYMEGPRLDTAYPEERAAIEARYSDYFLGADRLEARRLANAAAQAASVGGGGGFGSGRADRYAQVIADLRDQQASETLDFLNRQDALEAEARIADIRSSSDLELQLLDSRMQRNADESRNAREALTATLEAMGIRDAGTFRDYSLGTQASRTQLNRLTGVGSPIADFTQTVREEERNEQERLQEIDQEEARRTERARQRALANESNELYFRQQAVREQADRDLMTTIQLLNLQREGRELSESQRRELANAEARYRAGEDWLNSGAGLAYAPPVYSDVGPTTTDGVPDAPATVSGSLGPTGNSVADTLFSPVSAQPGPIWSSDSATKTTELEAAGFSAALWG